MLLRERAISTSSAPTLPRWAAPLLHGGVAVLVSFPGVLTLRTDLIGSPDVDVWNHAWGPWWWWHSLSQGALPWKTSLLLWPKGGVLWFIDPALALLGAPLVPLFGPVAAYNLVMLGSLAFSSWAAARFARALGVTGLPQLAASIALVASAMVTSELHNGISEACHVGVVALALAWVEEAARGETLRGWVKAGVGVGLAAVVSPYLGLGAGIAALVRGLPALRRAWVGGLTALVVAAPPALALRAQLHSPNAIIQHPESMNLELAAHNAVDPRTFLAPFGFQSVDLGAEGFLHSGYLGWVALGLTLWAWRTSGANPVWRRSARMWALAAAACAIFALGPFLFFDGDYVLANQRLLRMPWFGIQQLAPGLAVTHPLRLAVPVVAIVAALAARALVVSPRWVVGLALWALAVDGLVVSGAPWPLQTAPGQAPAALHTIAAAPHEPPRHAVLNLPTDVGATMATSRYLFWQTTHHRPIPYAPDARASTSSLLNESAFRLLAQLSSRREDEAARIGMGAAQGVPHAFGLADFGIRWLAVHHDLDPAAADRIAAQLTAELGPGVRTGDTTLWDLGAEHAGDGPRKPLSTPRPGQAPPSGSHRRSIHQQPWTDP